MGLDPNSSLHAVHGGPHSNILHRRDESASSYGEVLWTNLSYLRPIRVYPFVCVGIFHEITIIEVEVENVSASGGAFASSRA
eukprot:scaffold1184_cov132-Cylindrotheca_fusiformis.AAC.61